MPCVGSTADAPRRNVPSGDVIASVPGVPNKKASALSPNAPSLPDSPIPGPPNNKLLNPTKLDAPASCPNLVNPLGINAPTPVLVASNLKPGAKDSAVVNGLIQPLPVLN